jgi:hypothetical protein
VSAALFAFAGCGQTTSSSSNGTTPTPTPPVVSAQNDLSTIAAAFSDGDVEVIVRERISLNGGELAIPMGKTLTFEKNGEIVTGTMTDNVKIIGAGTLKYPDDKFIDWRPYPKAKLIVTPEFEEAYVYTGTGSLLGTKKIRANADQIVTIHEFAELEALWASGDLTTKYPLGSILALHAPLKNAKGKSVIDEAEADKINLYAKGHKVYIVGDIVLKGKIDLGATVYPPPVAESAGALWNYNTDLDSASTPNTFTVVGDVDAQEGTVKAAGFTVWGRLLDSTATMGSATITTGEITLDGTPFVGYTAYLNGAKFDGPVLFKGSMPSDFGLAVTFNDNVTITGPVVIRDALFAKSARFDNDVTVLNAISSGVRFVGPTDNADGTKNTVVFAGQLLIHSPKFELGVLEDQTSLNKSNVPTFTVTPEAVSLDGVLKAASLNGVPTVSVTVDSKPLMSTTYEYYGGTATLVVTKDARIGTQATIDGVLRFNNNLTFGTQATLSDTSDVYVAGDVTFEGVQEANKINGTLSVAGNAEFKDLADLGTAGVTIGHDVVFGSQATIGDNSGKGSLSVTGNATFNGDQSIGLYGTISIGGNATFNHIADTGTAGITIDGNATFGSQATIGDVSGKATLTVKGNATFGTGAVDVAGTLLVDGDATFNTKEQVKLGTASVITIKGNASFGGDGNTLIFGTQASTQTAAAGSKSFGGLTLKRGTFIVGQPLYLGKDGGVILTGTTSNTGGTITVPSNSDAISVAKNTNTLGASGDLVSVKGVMVTLNAGAGVNISNNTAKIALYEKIEDAETHGIILTGNGGFQVTEHPVKLTASRIEGLATANKGVVTMSGGTIIVPIQKTFTVGTATVQVNGGGILLGGTLSPGGIDTGTFSALELEASGGILKTTNGTATGAGAGSFVVAGKGTDGAMHLIGTIASAPGFGTYSSNIIHNEIGFIVTDNLLSGSSSAYTGAGVIPPGSIAVGSLGQ